MTTCPLCGATRLGKLRQVKDAATDHKRMIEVQKCCTCEILFQPSYGDDRSQLYGDSYSVWDRESEARKNIIEISKKRHFEFLFKRMLPGYSFCQKRILDIGTGKGYLLDVATALGAECYGVEISSYSAEVARKKHGDRVLTGTVEKVNLPTGFFDLVTMTDVLEHSPQPGNLLNRIHDILKPGGQVLITTPATDSLSCIILASNWFQFKYEHVTYWNKRAFAYCNKLMNLKLIRYLANIKYLDMEYLISYAAKYRLPLIKGLIQPIFNIAPLFIRRQPFKLPFTGECAALLKRNEHL